MESKEDYLNRKFIFERVELLKKIVIFFEYFGFLMLTCCILLRIPSNSSLFWTSVFTSSFADESFSVSRAFSNWFMIPSKKQISDVAGNSAHRLRGGGGDERNLVKIRTNLKELSNFLASQGVSHPSDVPETNVLKIS